MAVHELPLFPLNTVLFPGMSLNLHIFEERYKEMIRRCIDKQTQFGVSLIHKGAEAFGPPAEPYAIGCTAQIMEVQPLSDGRMNIVARGQERFRIVLLDRSKTPYLNSIIELFPLGVRDHDFIEQSSQQLKPWLQRYLETLAASGEIQMNLPEIPDTPRLLAYLAADTLKVSNQAKQNFLAIEYTDDLLTSLLSAYRREAAILKSLIQNSEPGNSGIFSVN